MDEIDAFFEPAKKVCMSEAECSACRNKILSKMQAHPVRDTEDACPMDHMTDLDPTLARAAKAISLSAEEATRCEKALLAFMEAHPVNMAAAVRQKETKSSFFSFFSVRFSPVIASVLVLVLGTGSLSYAAESALPGEALYPVKIHVNENIRTALSVTPAAKAEWETTQAQRRVKEATQLAAKGRLTPEQTATLTVAFDAHMAKAHTNMQAVADKGDHDRAKKIGERAEVALRKQVVALANNDAVVALREKVEAAADATVALDSAIGGTVAIETSDAPMAMMAMDSSKSTEENASSSSAAVVAVNLKVGGDARMMQKKDDTSVTSDLHVDGDATVKIAKDNSIQTFMMTTPPDTKKTQSSSKISKTGSSSTISRSSSSLTINSASSESVDIHVSSAGAPIKVDIQSDGSIDVKIVTPETSVIKQ